MGTKSLPQRMVAIVQKSALPFHGRFFFCLKPAKLKKIPGLLIERRIARRFDQKAKANRAMLIDCNAEASVSRCIREGEPKFEIGENGIAQSGRQIGENSPSFCAPARSSAFAFTRGKRTGPVAAELGMLRSGVRRRQCLQFRLMIGVRRAMLVRRQNKRFCLRCRCVVVVSAGSSASTQRKSASDSDHQAKSMLSAPGRHESHRGRIHNLKDVKTKRMQAEEKESRTRLRRAGVSRGVPTENEWADAEPDGVAHFGGVVASATEGTPARARDWPPESRFRKAYSDRL